MKVGEKLWYVPAYKYLGDPRELTVTKVGNKYVYADEGWDKKKIDKERMLTLSKTGDFIGQCYVDRQVYEYEQERQKLWTALRYWVDRRYNIPDDLSSVDLRGILAKLGVELSALET